MQADAVMIAQAGYANHIVSIMLMIVFIVFSCLLFTAGRNSSVSQFTGNFLQRNDKFTFIFQDS
jgi:uncharacterized membrane protein